MKNTAILLISLVLIAFPFVSFSDESNQDNRASVYGVMMYADWCGTCKALDPKIVQARKEAELDQQAVLFVRWDLTDETTQHQAKMMASALGLSKAYDENEGKTGFMMLYSAESGEKLAMITTKFDVDEIAAIIKEYI